MASPTDLEIYFNSVPQKNRHKLDKTLDFDHDGVQEDLGTIANSMDEWEGKVAEQLHLTKPEIEAIKTEFPGKLPLQTRAALQKWQEKFDPIATYRALITAFVRAGKGNCAVAVCNVLQKSGCQVSSKCPPLMELAPAPKRIKLDDTHPESTPMQRYANYLKGVYTGACVISDDKFFFKISCNEFINLALVKSNRVTPWEADEFTKATLHGHVDEILQKKEPIKLEDVLNPVKGQQRMKCVYIQGAPGVGKSTCVGELCRRWDEIDALKKYSLIILLRLREKQIQEAKNVEDLCYHDDSDLHQAVAADIKKCEGKGVLFVLDGFDELPVSLQEKNSIFVRLISGTYLSHCTVLVTSRPSATVTLLSVAQRQIHKQVEVIGFTQTHIEQYAKAVFASQPDVLADFLTYLDTHPAIRSMMYIPLSCTITTEVYKDKRIDNRPIPQTMTQLYVEMCWTLLQRHLGKDHPLAQQFNSLDDLPPELKEPFNSLAKLAFERLEREEVVFHDLPNGYEHFGFMNCPTEFHKGRKTAISQSFIHLTLQEFLAAFYISQLSPNDQKCLLMQHCEIASWNVVWRFVAGLTGFSGIGWEAVRGNELSVHPFLIGCLYEAQERVDCNCVLGESEVYFSGISSLTAFDCYAVGYCVTNSKCMWRLDMSGNESLGGVTIEMLKHGLCSPIKSPPQKKHANILTLDVHGCSLNSIAFNQLADIIPLMINLKKLEISYNPAGDGGLVKLLRTLSCLKHLQTLDMTDTNIGCADIEALSHLISAPSSSLKKLLIGDNKMSSEAQEVMLCAVLSPSSLESVKFIGLINLTGWDVTMAKENNNLTKLNLMQCDSTAFNQLADIIPLMINLKELEISNNPAGDGGLVKLLHALSRLKHLQTLDMTYTNIGCADIETLSHLISAPSSSLKKLRIGDKNMSSEATEMMLKTVLSPSSLESVQFCGLNLTGLNVTMGKENNNLTTLCLMQCDLTAFNQLADIIPMHLKHLQTLDMTYTNIGCADIEALSYLISAPSSSLKELWIVDKNMSSEATEMMLRTVLSPSSLESVQFSGLNLTGLDVILAEENKNLTTLSLICGQCDSTAFNQLADIIPLMINLKTLDISGNPAVNGGLVKLLNALSRLKHLQTLCMTDTNIGCADIEALSHLISAPSSSLKKLRIGDKNMSSETMEVTLKTVLSPSSLENVGLYGISLTGQDVTLLEENTNLTALAVIVGGLFITNDFHKLGRLIAKSLCKNSHLKCLCISDIDAGGVSSIEEMLRTNQTLETLKLPNVTPDHLLTLNIALQSNHTLKTIETFESSQCGLDLKALDPRITFHDEISHFPI